MKAQDIIKKALDYYYKRLSHKKIIFIDSVYDEKEYKNAYIEYMTKYRMFEDKYLCNKENLNDFKHLFKNEDKPTAILVLKKDGIDEIFDVLKECCLSVPDDVSVMCISEELDDNRAQSLTVIDLAMNLKKGDTTGPNAYYIESKKEIWDAYYPDGTMAGLDIIRGEEIPEHLRHMVSEVFVKHTDGTILVMRRDLSKLHSAGLWETGASGSVLKGEDAKEAAIRELSEESGIIATIDDLRPIYEYISSQSLYRGFELITDIKKDAIKLQEGETIDYKWLDKEEFITLFTSNEFVESMKKRIGEYVKSI